MQASTSGTLLKTQRLASSGLFLTVTREQLRLAMCAMRQTPVNEETSVVSVFISGPTFRAVTLRRLAQIWHRTLESKTATLLRLFQFLDLQGKFGRGEKIRTSGLYVPNARHLPCIH